MDSIYLINEHSESFLAQGLKSVLDAAENSEVFIAPYLPEIGIVPTFLIFFVKDDADVKRRVGDIGETLATHVKLAFIYLSDLEEDSIKLLATFSKVAVLSVQCTTVELIQSFSQLDVEDVVLCSHTKEVMLKHILRSGVPKPAFELSATERAIIKASKKGFSIIETAAELKLSTNTIAAYRSKILKKTGFKTMPSLLAQMLP